MHGKSDAPIYYNGIGYSAIAIIFVIMVGSLTVLSVLVPAMLMKLDPSMPVLQSGCSAVISAACHVPKGDTDSHLQEIQWGAVVVDYEEGSLSESSSRVDLNDDGVDVELAVSPRQGHCCFTTFEVSRPISGEVYS